MARTGTQRSTGPPTTGGPFQTCELVWWRGYVKGHFEAWTRPPSGNPRLVGESPAFRWRSSAPPPDAEPASSAVETLLGQLAEDGWEVAVHSSGSWYERVLWRPYDDEEEAARAREREERGAEPVDVYPGTLGDRGPRQVHAPEPFLAELPAPPTEAPKDAVQEPERHALVESGLRQVAQPDQEGHALVESELHQVDESEHGLRLLGEPPVAVRSRRSFVSLAVYGLTVAAAAGFFVAVFHSAYAAGVAALTATALALGIDSWLVARRQSRVISRRGARPER